MVAGVRLTALHARERKLPDMSGNLAVIAIVAGLIGARAFFLLETDPGALLRPSEWVGTRGFAFNGALIGAGAAIALYVWSRALSARYLDAVALAFPLGMAIGRIGDVINGEHYGAPTQQPWGVRNTHPDAAVPDPTVAYHSEANERAPGHILSRERLTSGCEATAGTSEDGPAGDRCA